MTPLAVDPIAALAPLVEPSPLDVADPGAGSSFQDHFQKAVESAPAESSAASPTPDEPRDEDDNAPVADDANSDADAALAAPDEPVEPPVAVATGLPEPATVEAPLLRLPQVVDEPKGDGPAKAVDADAAAEQPVIQPGPVADGPVRGTQPATDTRPGRAARPAVGETPSRRAAPPTPQPTASPTTTPAEPAATAAEAMPTDSAAAAPTAPLAETVASGGTPLAGAVVSEKPLRLRADAATGQDAARAAGHDAVAGVAPREQPAQPADGRPAAEPASRRTGSRRREDREPPAPHEFRRGAAPPAFALPSPVQVAAAGPAGPAPAMVPEPRATSEAVDAATAVEASAPTEPARTQPAATTPAVERATPQGDAAPGRTETTPPLARRLETVVGPRGSRGEPGDGLSPADRVRFVQRVARAFETAAERGGPLRLRLSPPELGSLRLEVQLRDGTLQAHIEAETPEARGLLLEQLPALRERLAQQQVRLERFDVDVRREGSDGSPQAFDQGRREEARAERRGAARSAPRGETVAAPRTGAEPRAASGRLDVTV